MDIDQGFSKEFIERVEKGNDSDLHKFYKLQSINLANTPIYAALAYFITKSKIEMHRIHDAILDIVCYIGCVDILLETNNNAIKTEMEFFETRCMSALTEQQSNIFKSYLGEIVQKGKSLHAILKKKLYGGELIAEEDIKEATLIKSSDVKIYLRLLSLLLNDKHKIPKCVIDAIHLKQIKQDFLDDFEDLEEDLKLKEVSPLLIRVIQKLGIEFVENSNNEILQQASKEYGAFRQQEECINKITLAMEPLADNYQWISNKSLQPKSKDYGRLSN